MAKKYNYNYNNSNMMNNRKKVDFNPWAVLILFIVLLAVNVYFAVKIGLDLSSGVALIACAIGIVMSIVNIIKRKNKKK